VIDSAGLSTLFFHRLPVYRLASFGAPLSIHKCPIRSDQLDHFHSSGHMPNRAENIDFGKFNTSYLRSLAQGPFMRPFRWSYQNLRTLK